VQPTGGRAGSFPSPTRRTTSSISSTPSGQPWGQDTIEDAVAAQVNAANGDELIVLVVGQDKPKRAAAKVAKQSFDSTADELADALVGATKS